MDLLKQRQEIAGSVKNAKNVSVIGLKVLNSNAAILAYPVLAFWLILLSMPLVVAFILSLSGQLDTIFNGYESSLKAIFSAAVISYIYVSIVMAYFTCAIAAATATTLENHPDALLHSLRVILKKFFYISKFALVSPLLPVISLIARRRNILKDPLGSIGGSISINIALLAPVILHQSKSIPETIRTMADTLGSAWKDQLVLKVWLYITLFVLSSIGFLPQLISRYWFDKGTAESVEWAVSALLWLTILVATKVVWGVFTAVLYWQLQSSKK